MALTIGMVNLGNRNHVIGNRRQVVLDVTFDNSYPTGGYALTPATLGVDGVTDLIRGDAFLISTVAYVPVYNYSTSKLQVTTGNAEVASTTDLHLGTTRLTAQGKGSPLF